MIKAPHTTKLHIYDQSICLLDQVPDKINTISHLKDVYKSLYHVFQVNLHTTNGGIS